MSVVLWKEIHEVANKVCKEFGLSYGKIVPETRKLVRHYGECMPCTRCLNNDLVDHANCSEKILYIRIHQLNNPNKPLARYTILSTLAHELAHLRSDLWYHSKAHQRFEKEIMNFIKEEGYI